MFDWELRLNKGIEYLTWYALSLQEQVVLGYEQLALFKKEAEVLRQETDVLMN